MVKNMRSCMSGSNLVNVNNSTVKILHQNDSRVKCDKNHKSYPIARWKHASVVFQNHLYIMGGCSWTTILKDLWSFDLLAFSEAVQGELLMKGCWNDFDLQGNSLEICQDLSNFIGDIPPLQCHTMVAYGNQLYIFGGTFVYDARDCPLWIYSLEFQIMRKWKSVSDKELPTPRRNHSCSIYRDTMLIYGGFGDIRGSFGDLWAFDLKKEDWHLVWSFVKNSKDMTNIIGKVGPCPRHDHMSVVHNNALWIYGGMSGLEECYDLWKWNIEECEWTRINFKISPVDVRFISNIIIRQNWIFYCVNETKKKFETWKYSFRSNKWTSTLSNFSDLPLHSTICLSSNDTNRSTSINQYDNGYMRRNKVHPVSDVSFATQKTNDCICLRTCSTFDVIKPNKLSINCKFEKLTPVDLSPERYAYSNNDCYDQLETTFTENFEESFTVSTPKLREYMVLFGNNIDKASFENDIGIHFSLIR